MSEFRPRPYEPKDSLNVAGLPLVVAALVAGRFGIGWLASFIGQRHYLIVVFPAGMGFLLILVGVWAGRVGKMRSRQMAVVLGCGSAVVTVFFLHYFDYRHFLAQRPQLVAEAEGLLARVPPGVQLPGVGEARQLIQLAREVDSFGSFLKYMAKQGVSISFRSDTFSFNIGFLGTWIYWISELAAIAALATIGLRSGASEPFCSRCDAWKEERELGTLKKKGCNVAGYVRQGEIGELRTHVAKADGGNLILSAAVCPSCEADATIVVKVVELKKNKRGQNERIELTRVTYPGKALADFETLFETSRRDVPDGYGAAPEPKVGPPAAQLSRAPRPSIAVQTRSAEPEDDEDEFEPSANKYMPVVWVLGSAAIVIVVGLVGVAAFMRPGKDPDRRAPAAENQVVGKKDAVTPQRISIEEARKQTVIERSPDQASLIIPQPDAPGLDPNKAAGPGPGEIQGAKPDRRVALPSQPQLPLSEADAATALIDLRSPDQFRRSRAAGKIAGAAVNPARRVEIAQALEPLLTDTYVIGRMNAAKAMKTWAIHDNGPALLRALDDSNSLVHKFAIEALGAIKYEPAAETLVRGWSKSADRHLITKALQMIGPAVEKVVLPCLQDPDRQVRVEACKVLEAAGTSECTPALESIRGGRDRTLSKAAEDALKAVAGRQ